MGPLFAAAAPRASDPDARAGTVLVDIRPEPAVPGWIAGALEQNITQELLGYQHVRALDKRDVDTRGCRVSDTRCRLRRYREAGVDIVMFGAVSDADLRFEVFECWTPSRVRHGSFGLDTSAFRMKQQILRAAAPILRRGGLIDQKRFARVRRPLSGARGPDSGRRVALGLVFLAAALFFAIPVLLFAAASPRPRSLSGMRSRIWIVALAAATALLAILLIAGLSFQPLWTWLASWEWLIALAGGLAWGALILSTSRTAFPPIRGLERIAHRDVLRLLGAWLSFCAQRVVLLAAFYAPLAALLWTGCTWFPEQAGLVVLLLAPLGGLTLRGWFLSLVESCSVYLDRRLVDGPATSQNPRHRDVRRYLQGYLNRTGWWVDDRLLDGVLFLPGNTDTVLCYGGGVTHPRVVIPVELLTFAIGESEELPPQSRFVPWADGRAGTVVPGADVPAPDAPAPDAPPPRAARLLPPLWQTLRRLLGLAFARPPRRRPELELWRGLSRKRRLGQAATSLGYVVPFPPEELVPLIADGTEDFEIVRELLAEHYAWFEADPDELSDDTDPTDRDLLFGALVREIGQIEREEAPLNAVVRAIEARGSGSCSCVRWLGRRAAGVHRRLFARAGVMLADGYAALNHGRHHLVQHLYRGMSGPDDLLTTRADEHELHRVSTEIFARVAGEGQDRRRRRPTLRNRLIWLSQFFHARLPMPGRRWVRILAGACACLAAATGAFLLVKQAVDYHPTYVERIAAQQRRIDQARAKRKRDQDRNIEHVR